MKWREVWVQVGYGTTYLDCVTKTHAYGLSLHQVNIGEINEDNPYSVEMEMEMVEVKDLPPEIQARYEEVLPLLRIAEPT